MSSPIAFVGLTFDSTDVQRSDLSWFLWIEKGLDEMPSVRGEDTVVPGLGGRFEGTRVNDLLPIELRGQVTADPALTDMTARRSSWRDNMRDLRALFASNRTRAALVATLEDGSSLTIDARPLNLVVTRRIGSEYAFLSIEMEGYDDWVAAGS